MCQSMEGDSGLVKRGSVLGGVVHVVIDQLGVKVRGGVLVVWCLVLVVCCACVCVCVYLFCCLPPIAPPSPALGDG